jgi:uncharacterized membrane protein
VAGVTGILALVALVSIIGVGAAGPAKAATSKPQGVILLSGHEAGGTVQLKAMLFDAGGVPMPSQPVKFGFNTKLFGKAPRMVPLGTVSTDTKGVALLTLGSDAAHSYKPTTKGPQFFVATYGDDANPVTGHTTVNVTVAQSAYHPAPGKPLAGVGNILVMALFSIVAAIWLTLFIQVLRVRRVCKIRKTSISTA